MCAAVPKLGPKGLAVLKVAHLSSIFIPCVLTLFLPCILLGVLSRLRTVMTVTCGGTVGCKSCVCSCAFVVVREKWFQCVDHGWPSFC